GELRVGRPRQAGIRRPAPGPGVRHGAPLDGREQGQGREDRRRDRRPARDLRRRPPRAARPPAAAGTRDRLRGREDVAEDLSVPRPVATRPAEPAAQKPRRVHAKRFMAAYILLALAVLGAVAMFVMAMNTESESERAWSTWQPNGSGESRIWEIA